MRWGIVGASDIADRVMAPAMRASTSAEFVGIASRSQERADWFVARHGGRAFPSAAVLAADPNADAVYVATEVDRHCEEVLAIASGGKDVLVEKPIARTAAEAQRMVDACRAAGVRLGTCYYKRFNARHQRVRELIQAGALGIVSAASADYSGRLPPTRDAWRRDPARAGGGPFIDGGSHIIDLLRFLLADEVVAVTAVTSDAVDGGPVEDTAFAILRFSRGVLASIAAHWSVADTSDRRTNSLRVSGTAATVETWPLYEKFSRGHTLVSDGAAERELEVPEASTHVALLDAFAKARAGGRPFPITGEDGLAAARVVDAVYASAREGRTVAV